MKDLTIEDLTAVLHRLDQWKDDYKIGYDDCFAARYRLIMKAYSEAIAPRSPEDSVQEFMDVEWTNPSNLSYAAELIKSDYPSTARLLERIRKYIESK